MSQPDPATSGVVATTTEVGSVFVSNYPPYSVWSEDDLADAVRALDTAPTGPSRPLGLYLHIPFCRKRCRFCYFRVYTDKNGSDISRYCDSLAHEVELLAGRPAVAGRSLDFVYFGGGTPSYISVQHLRELVGRISTALPWSDVREVTFECEPGTLTQAKVEAIREIGVTRLSLGVENFDDEILKENGRAHLSEEIYRTMPWIREAGFAQLNIDLIAGMVGETWETWRDSVAKTIELDPDSVTIYQMELPFNTKISGELLEGGLGRPLADWPTKREWHDFALEELAAAGYEPSSAYTMVKAGRHADFVYRDALWHGSDLLGTGVASFSHLGGTHYQNLTRWDEYLNSLETDELPLGRAYTPTDGERLTREVVLQLKRGHLEADYFHEKFGVDILDHFRGPLERLRERSMLEISEHGVELTRAGLLQVDFLLPELYEKKYRNARYT